MYHYTFYFQTKNGRKVSFSLSSAEKYDDFSLSKEVKNIINSHSILEMKWLQTKEEYEMFFNPFSEKGN